jgi:DNA-binding transcriptional ArsR family regulator
LKKTESHASWQPSENHVDNLLKDYAAKFQVLADPLRLKIIILLRDGEKCVCELVDSLGQKQPLVSYHLKLMTSAGLIRKRMDGNWAYYSLSNDVTQWFKNCCTFLTSDDIALRGKRIGPEQR